VRELRMLGSVRGALSNECPYRNPHFFTLYFLTAPFSHQYLSLM
jgi:hypothetical protein